MLRFLEVKYQTCLKNICPIFHVLIIIFQFIVLKQTFEVIPRGGYYKRNEIVVLYCKPPYGRPKPLVKWYKNGKKIQRLIIDSYGTLTITSFEPADEGYYHCEAHSVAGIRRSPETVVSLLGKFYYYYFR